MPDRQYHLREVQAFLQRTFASPAWEVTLPEGSGNETYFARNHARSYFVKLGAQAARYQALAALGLTPEVLAAGAMEDGTPIIVQPYIAGRRPTRTDYRRYLEQFASAIHTVHDSAQLKQVLPPASSDLYRAAAEKALGHIQRRWESHRAQAAKVAGFIDESLAYLGQQISSFQGSGLAASHNDICNANWLLSQDEHIYLIDLEAMSLDDPALDIGATLWWYYPPELRQQFLTIAGHANDRAFERRMQVRMAMHCLHIILPREQSFDTFEPDSFAGALVDFRAILAGEENPQGYEE